ncbi:glycosyltransferase family 2 protein [Phycisphaerales bacterium AB-hyl4]|uniref:Glycosyltransferase family 2 protein n=1 Tax=Natronomicrosphaera hydrolytica TaxID=3242702 RepID=A0ABV4U2N5_9BACT
MTKISVVMISFNAGELIEPALRSARWADEIVVVDSGSTDGTPAIGRRYANRFLHEDWRGFTAQKQFAVSLASNDWVFILDQDEEISPELAAQIQALDDDVLSRCDLFEVRRRNYAMGRPVRAWWPDHQSRLFHRGRCRWADEAIHDRRHPSEPGRTAKLTGWLEHRRHCREGFFDFNVGRISADRLRRAVMQMHDRGKLCHWWDVFIHPTAAFIKSYFMKRGFLDGVFGFMVARQQAHTTYLRYAALWAIQHDIAYQASDDDDQPRSTDSVEEATDAAAE